MNKLFTRLSPRSVKLFLIVFCMSAGGYSFYLIADSIFNKQNVKPSIQIDQVEVPKHYNQSGDESLRSDQYVDDATYRDIVAFKIYMDSLKAKKPVVYDSIMKARPGLMDSVLILETIYNSQQLK